MFELEQNISTSQELDVINAYSRRAIQVFVDLESRICQFSARQKDESLVNTATENKCGRISLLVAIAAKNSGLFKQVFLVEGQSAYKEPFKRAGWIKHTYAIMQSRGRTWFYTSPANFAYASKDRPADEVNTAQSLGCALSEIYEYEGGIWPESNKIFAALKELRASEISLSSGIPYIHEAPGWSGESSIVATDAPLEKWAYDEMFKK